MNAKQAKATMKLEAVLAECHKAGLKGGVFDCSFCVWPANGKPDPYESGSRFFEVIEDIGEVIHSPMSLDGGAGV